MEQMEHYGPDWSKAPYWARFWAISRDKFPDGDAIWANWYEKEPSYRSGIWICPTGRGQEDASFAAALNEKSIDGPGTLRRRPA